MVSSRKIVALLLCIFASTFCIVDAGHHGGGNSGLAEMLAAGLVTLLIRDGGKSLFGGGGGGGRSAGPHGMEGRHNYVQEADFALGHSLGRSMQDFGSEFEIFDYMPSFGGHRYNLGDIENSYPFNEYDLIEDIVQPVLRQDLGLDAKMYNQARAIANNEVDKIVEELRLKALQRQIEKEERSTESKEERDRNERA